MDINILINRPFVKGFELRQGVEVFAHKLTAALGLDPIKIEWCNISTAAMSAHGNMLLSAVADDARIGRGTLVRYVGFVVHELLHRKYTDFYSVPRDSSLVIRLHNALEDIWIEHRGIASGVTGNIGTVLGALVDQIAAEALVAVQDWADPAQYPFVLAIYGRRHASVKLPLAIGLGPLFDEALRRLEVSRSTLENAEIARWLASQLTRNATEDELRDDLNDDPDEGTPGDSTDGTPCDDGDPGSDPGGDQGGGQDDGTDGADQGGDQGADQGDQGGGKGDKGDADGEADGGSDGEAKGDAEAEADGNKKGGEAGEGGHRRGDTSAPKAAPRRRANPNGDFREVEPTMDADPEGASCRGEKAEAQDHRHLGVQRELNINVPARLRFELRRLLDNSGTTAFEQRRKSGSVDVRSLARVATDGRLFQRRHDTDGVDTAVALVLDISGSMLNKLNIACDAAAALCDTLIKAEANVALVTFAGDVAVQAPFGSSFKQISTALRHIVCYGNTNDVFAVRTAQDLLLRRHEARKIMFVLTDGEGYPADAKRQVQAATALGITVIGVGIRSRVRHIYGQGVTVTDLSGLGGAMFREIKLAA